MGGTEIIRVLGNSIYDGLANANAPSALNPFATLSDLFPTYNELDPVINQQTTPPGAPTTGDRYLVAVGGLGAWAGQDNNIAEWDGASWLFTVPNTDDIVEIINLGVYKRFNGTSWVAYGGTSILQGGNSLSTAMSIGTKTNQVFYVRTNNANRIRVHNGGMNVAGTFYVGSLTGTATANFHVAGTLRLITGSQAAGRVLTSDAFGNADWATPSSGWELNGNTVGSVKTIGTIDAFDFPIITQNIERARFFSNGKITIGTGATSADASSVVIGPGATGGTNREVAVGDSAIASSQGVSVGFGATTNDRGVAAGYLASSTGIGVAIGESASAVGGVSIRGSGLSAAHTAIMGTVTGGGFGISIQGSAEANDNITVGFRTRATANGAMIFGRSVDNATYLTNAVADSVGFGWSEATPTVLFAKTADQYIGGTGNLGIGIVSPTAKLHVKGTGTAAGTFIQTATDSSNTVKFQIDDYGNFGINTTVAAWGATVGIRQSSSTVPFNIAEPTNNYTIFQVYNDSTYTANGFQFNVGGNQPASIPMVYYPCATANYGSLRLGGGGSQPWQLFSSRSGASYGHIAFINGAGGGMYLDQDASSYYRWYMVGSAGSPTPHLLSSNSTSWVAANSTQFGVGTDTTSAKLHIKSIGNNNTTYFLKGYNSDNELLYAHTDGGVIEHYTNTAVGASVTDGYLQYSADIVAGNAAPHFKTESGNVIKLFTSPAYTVTNLTTDRSYNANVTNVLELADVLGTLIADLQATGIIG